MDRWELVLMLGVAVLVESTLGELPNRWHPVVWMGTLTKWLERWLFRGGARWQLFGGAVVALGLPLGFACGAWALLHGLPMPPTLRVLVGGLLLSTTFAVRALGQAAHDLANCLPFDLTEARRRLGALCSRDPSELDASDLAGAAIESVAENTSDSVVAPVFFFVLLGVPGAVFYRAVNTLDAMIGYRGRYESFGKTAARLDDVLNWFPARLTSCLLIGSAAFPLREEAPPGASLPGSGLLRMKRAMATAWRDHGRTESPNAGWPMAAMAGALGVMLEKRDHYRLGADGAAPTLASIDRAWCIARRASVAAFLITALAQLVLFFGGDG